jgi:hypothetical protein
MPRKKPADLDAMIEDATVDCNDESDQIMGFHAQLDEHLDLPFSTSILGVDVKVEKLDVTERNDIVAVCSRGKLRQRVLLLDLPLPTPPPRGSEWIDAFRRFGAQR